MAFNERRIAAAFEEEYYFHHDLVDDDDATGEYGNYLQETIRMSRLSIENSDGEDADAELSEKEEEGADADGEGDGDESMTGFTSVPGTPGEEDRIGVAKQYASETEAGRVKRGGGRRRRERKLERVWERKRWRAAVGGSRAAAEGPCRLLVRPQSEEPERCVCMDLDEVRACRDLGIELPMDWTVEISGGFSGSAVDTSSGGDSPSCGPSDGGGATTNRFTSRPGENRFTSSPGDDPSEMKAKLKAWAHTVALAMATHLD